MNNNKNKDRLAICIGGVDDKYITEAENFKKSKLTAVIMKYSTVAAAVLIIAAAIWGINSTINIPSSSGGGAESGIGSSEGLSSGEASEKNQKEENKGLYIKPEKIPDEEAMTDRIGLILYNGKIYIQSARYTDGIDINAEEMLDEYLGYAKGNIDIPCTDEEDMDSIKEKLEKEGGVDIPSMTMPGEVYSVKGYDKEFRICIADKYLDNDGNEVSNLIFYECLNDIWLDTGADLISERMRVPEKWTEVIYYDYDRYGSLSEALGNDEINAFLDELCAAKFVEDSDYVSERYNSEMRTVFLQFHLDDGTSTVFTLFEDGTITFYGLYSCYIDLSGENFDKIFEACKF